MNVETNVQQRYHDENTKEEDLIHPEDIEHFKQHDQLEDEAEKQAQEDKMPVVEHNIPLKFRRFAISSLLRFPLSTNSLLRDAPK